MRNSELQMAAITLGPLQKILLTQGLKLVFPVSPSLQADSLPLEPSGKPGVNIMPPKILCPGRRPFQVPLETRSSHPVDPNIVGHKAQFPKWIKEGLYQEPRPTSTSWFPAPEILPVEGLLTHTRYYISNSILKSYRSHPQAVTWVAPFKKPFQFLSLNRN